MDFDTLILTLENDFKTWKDNKASQKGAEVKKVLDATRQMAGARDRAERAMYAYIRQQLNTQDEAIDQK